MSIQQQTSGNMARQEPDNITRMIALLREDRDR